MTDTSQSSRAVSRLSGLLLFALLCVSLGFLIAHKRSWPYAQVMQISHVVTSLLTHGEVIGDGRRMPAPDGASPKRVTLHDPARAQSAGYFALLEWNNTLGTYAVALQDATGQDLHIWPVDERAFSDIASHNQHAPHAMEVLRDGSVLVSFDWLGLMARIDACGDAIWTRDGFFHHSFAPSADGGIWTWYGKGTAYGQAQDIVKFDPLTGADMQRLSFEKDVVKRGPQTAAQFSLHTDYAFPQDDAGPLDIFHPNDVEELLPDLAAAFPMFDAGDLMLSIRELDLVMVISPHGVVKWSAYGPWQKQHDPDFETDGRISIFDNSRNRPHSMILSIDPETRQVTNAFPGLTLPFKSRYRGKHQLLPNGNRLITIPEQGQALELAPDGALIREINNIIPKRAGVHDDLVNAKWYAPDYFTSQPNCAPE